MNKRQSTLPAFNFCPNFNLKIRRDILLLAAIEKPLEEIMWKTALAGTAALAIAGGSFVYAQQGPGGLERGPRHERGPHWRMTAEDMSAFADARIAAIHAGLKLTPEQEKNWPAVETALRDLGKQRSARFAARASADTPKDPIERLNLRAETLTQRGATLKKLADAANPLYQSLDEGQKHRFVMLAHFEGRNFDHERGPHSAGGWMHRMGGWMHRGPAGPDGGPAGPDGSPRPPQ
jgi:zinc resistance-associated protein